MSNFFKRLFGRLTIDDLPKGMPETIKLRQKARILFIDDKGFTHKDALQNLKFNIETRTQWASPSDVQNYDIIVSDNQGVAANIGKDMDGLTMVKQSNKLYPEKSYVLFSADLIDIRGKDTEGFPIMTKGDTADDWTLLFDNTIEDAFNPRNAWRKIQRVLESRGLSEKECRKLQNAYVNAVLSGDENLIAKKQWSLDLSTIQLIVRIAGLGVQTVKLLMSSGIS